MEAVNAETRRRVIADFYRKNSAKGKSYCLKHFVKMSYKKTQIYKVMSQVDAGESVERIREKIRQADQREIPKMFRSIKANILITANEGPYATFH